MGKVKAAGKVPASPAKDAKAKPSVPMVPVALALAVAIFAAVLMQQKGGLFGSGGGGLSADTRRRTDHGQTEILGDEVHHPSFGLFPRGCKWRAVTGRDGKFNANVTYAFWDSQEKKWSRDRPAACAPQGIPAPGPPGWTFNKGSPRSELTCDQTHCMYTNLFYNRGRFYALVDGPHHVPNYRFSRNQEVSTIPVADAWDFLDSVR
jgi:hypothetical protein